MEVQIQKHTGTYADTLEAVGSADLLNELTGEPVRIEDEGVSFHVSTSLSSPETWRSPSPGYPYIFLKNKEQTPPGGEVLDYEEGKRKAEAVRAFRTATGEKKSQMERALNNQGLLSPPEPDREYRLASIMASVRMGWESDKKLFQWISEHPEETLDWIKNRWEQDREFEPSLTLTGSQFFSPATGKGVHSPKTVSKSPGSINKALIDPFREWMKYRGAFNAMIPCRVGEDFKLYVIEPADITISAIRDLRYSLMDLGLWGGKIQLDIQTSLRLAEQLILNSDVLGRNIGLGGRLPNEIVKGIRQAYFKRLGTASALMNNAFLPLPSWFVISNREAANVYLEIIQEHLGESGWRGCLGSLHEDKSDHIPVLQQYRNWLNTGDLFDFLEFTALYALHVYQELARNNFRVRLFNVKNLNNLLLRGYPMKTEDIITREGFLSIARAIRNSTIYAVGTNISRREPRFGLAQSWKQKIKGGTETFVAVLSDFVQQYNWESAHKLEGKAHMVQEPELNQVLQLIDKYGAELVGMLLLAYGFARKPKESADEMPDELLETAEN